MPSYPDVRVSISLFQKAQMDFIIHQADESSNPKYYGYLSGIGTWIIMQQNTATGAHRYAVGKTDFSTNWTGRAALSYDYFNLII